MKESKEKYLFDFLKDKTIANIIFNDENESAHSCKNKLLAKMQEIKKLIKE